MIRVLCALLLAFPAHAAITIIDTDFDRNASGVPATCALNTLVGDVVVIGLDNVAAHAGAATITSTGETFSQLGSTASGAGNGASYRAAFYTATIASASATENVSISWNSDAMAYNWTCYQLRGATTTNAQTGAATGTGTTASLTLNTTSLGAGAAAFASVSNAYGAEPIQDTGYTLLDLQNLDGYEGAQYNADIGATSATKTVQMVSGASGDWLIRAIAIGADSGGASSGLLRRRRGN